MMTFEEKTELNKWVQARYDELMHEGKRGHYETMFKVVHEAIRKVDERHEWRPASVVNRGRPWPTYEPVNPK